MIAFSAKAWAVAAITMSLSSSALACLRINGMAYASASTGVGGSITTIDSGVQTCKGDVGVGDSNIDCISGYSLNYDYTDNPQQGPLPMTYCNPSNCYGTNVPLTCYDDGICTFGYSTFCG